MALSPISRRAGMLSVTAAVLIVLSQVMRLAVGRLLGPGWATTPAYTLTYTLALLGMGTLLLALTAIYTRESAALGRLGLIGYLTAFLGTLMVAGDWWFEAFAVPMIATEAPEVLDLPPSGSVLVGAIATVGLYTVGWTLFGLAALRARAFPRAAGLLLLAGGLAGPLALSTPYQIPLAIAIGWIGLTLQPESRSASPQPPPPPQPTRHPPAEQRYSHEALTTPCHPFPRGSGLRHRVGGARVYLCCRGRRPGPRCHRPIRALGDGRAAHPRLGARHRARGPHRARAGLRTGGQVRTGGDPADAVPDRIGDQVVHRAGHHAAERGGPGATGCAGAAVPAVVAGRRSGRVDPGHGPPSAVPGQRAVEGDRQRVRDQRGHPRLRPRGPGPGAARCRTHPAGGHDLAVQQRQLLDPGHDRAGGLGPVVRDLHSAAHLRPAADGQLLHVADRGAAARPTHGPPLLVRLPRRLRTALRSRRPGFPRPQLQRAGHDPLPQPLPQPGPTGATALVSPAGAAELQRAGVPTGLDGVSYAMGWDVGPVHGVPTISHDGSGFDSHANVVLVPDRGWGVVVMENGENSPDEFFGSRRMTGIANGVAGMLIGREPPAPTSSSRSLWVVYGVVLGIIVMQVGGMARSVRTIRGWRTAPLRRPTGALRIGLRVGLPLLVSWTWALLVLVGLPRIIRAPLPAVLMGLPDLGYPLVASAVLAFGWGLARVIWAVRTLRSTLPSVPRPSNGDTAELERQPSLLSPTTG